MVVVELQRTDSFDFLLAGLVNAQCHDLLLVFSASVLFSLGHVKFYYCNYITAKLKSIKRDQYGLKCIKLIKKDNDLIYNWSIVFMLHSTK
jgi:hypothetical protein